MSVKHNGKTIASNPKFHPDLLEFKWSDHLLNDPQWLRADTFSQQYKSVYGPAYDHLADDIVGKTLQSETVAGITIQFYLADDGHKICPVSEESNVTAIYNATGVAWYYIIDTTNQWFKLPRGKHNKYAATLGVAGNGITLGLTDGTNNYGMSTNNGGALIPAQSNYGQSVGSSVGTGYVSNKTIGFTTDPTKSGIIALQDQDTDEYKYLYFYMGQFTQTAIENTAGINTELFNNKADITAVAGLAAPDYQNITQLSNIDSYQQIQGDGYIFIQGAGGGSWNTIGIVISLDGSTKLLQITQANIYGIAYLVPVSKGVYVKRYDSHTTNLTFIPCKGNN
jgi:hypothetical protein